MPRSGVGAMGDAPGAPGSARSGGEWTRSRGG